MTQPIVSPPPAWPGLVTLRRPTAGYADLPTAPAQPAILRTPPPLTASDPTDPAGDDSDTTGQHHAAPDATRDPRGWWWITNPVHAAWRPPPRQAGDVDGPTRRLNPAAVLAAAAPREEHHR